MKQLGVYLTFPGSCAEALDFYSKTLGGEIVSKQTFGESPEPMEGYNDRIMHSEFKAEGISFMASDSMPGQDVSRGGPVRFVIDLASRQLVDRVALDYEKAPDFPAIDAAKTMRAYDDFWMLGLSATGQSGRKFFDQLVHANWNGGVSDIYQSPPMRYLGGEPVFVVGRDSGEGIIICQEFDAAARTHQFLVFEAFRVATGPIARIPLQHPVHLGFHAAFRPSVPSPE